ncbi:unnamed protein product [Periconia digitata]|uniref:Uncharacterized protein n=1 Tax=Periconia digitata TaxID=1303443 RepID=A0A9W4UMV0_9PLEO|nr:unnamed protein product [Periconia digitata]
MYGSPIPKHAAHRPLNRASAGGPNQVLRVQNTTRQPATTSLHNVISPISVLVLHAIVISLPRQAIVYACRNQSASCRRGSPSLWPTWVSRLPYQALLSAAS